MKRSSKIIIITVLSLGLVGGVLAYGKHKYSDPAVFAEHISKHISDELDLNSQQQESLAVLKEAIMAKRKHLRSQTKALPDEVIDLIAADSFDQQKALTLINNKTTAINESAPELIAALGSFIDELDTEQKAKVMDFIEHKSEHRKHHH